MKLSLLHWIMQHFVVFHRNTSSIHIFVYCPIELLHSFQNYNKSFRLFKASLHQNWNAFCAKQITALVCWKFRDRFFRLFLELKNIVPLILIQFFFLSFSHIFCIFFFVLVTFQLCNQPVGCIPVLHVLFHFNMFCVNFYLKYCSWSTIHLQKQIRNPKWPLRKIRMWNWGQSTSQKACLDIWRCFSVRTK